jgi:hypothetical protein
MTINDKDAAMDASPDYAQVGRFIYGTARLEGALAGLLRLMRQGAAEDHELAANARAADALFGRLAVDDGDKAACAALMQALASFGEQRDGIFSRITELPPEELGARNEELAAWTQEAWRFQAIALALVPKG